MTLPHLGLMVVINLLFGFNIIAAKTGVSAFSPIFFSALRFLLLAVVLLPFLKLHKGQMMVIIWTAVTGGAIHFALVFLGLALSKEVSTVAIGMQMVVPFATILSIIFLNETIGWKRWLGIGLSFAGVLIIGFDPKVFSYLTGLILVVLGAFVAAVSMLLIKQIKGVKVFQIQAWLALISGPLLLLTSLLFEEHQLQQVSQAGLEAWGALLFTAFAASLVGHGGFYYLIQRYDMSQVAPLTLLAAVFAIFFGVILLGDELTTRIIQGGILALLGVLLITLRQTTAQVVATGGGSVARKIDPKQEV